MRIMATDAEIRAAGLYAVPDRRFLQNEFQLPTNTPVEEVTESFGIPNTLMLLQIAVGVEVEQGGGQVWKWHQPSDMSLLQRL